jgi:hypothetical protein
MFGAATAGIFHFQYLFGIIVVVFVVYYLATRWASLAADMRHIAAASACFFVFMLPLVPQLTNMYRTRNTHVFADAPQLGDVLLILTPGRVLWVFAGAALVAALTRKLITPSREMFRTFLFCFLLPILPTAILYGVSVLTPLHLFIPRYLLIAVPGVALGWAWLIGLIDSRILRLLFCVGFVAINAFEAFTSPFTHTHGYTWKYALEFADGNAAPDHAPLLICSDLPEADSQPMPAGPAEESILFAPLSYYKVSAPIIPLPRSLNAEAQRQIVKFLPQAETEHRRFLVLAFVYSGRILDWVAYQTRYTHTPRLLGQFGGVWVVEYAPRAGSG